MKPFHERLDEYVDSVMRMCDCSEEYQRVAIKAGIQNFHFEMLRASSGDLFEKVRASSAQLGETIAEWERAFGKKRYL